MIAEALPTHLRHVVSGDVMPLAPNVEPAAVVEATSSGITFMNSHPKCEELESIINDASKPYHDAENHDLDLIVAALKEAIEEASFWVANITAVAAVAPTSSGSNETREALQQAILIATSAATSNTALQSPILMIEAFKQLRISLLSARAVASPMVMTMAYQSHCTHTLRKTRFAERMVERCELAQITLHAIQKNLDTTRAQWVATANLTRWEAVNILRAFLDQIMKSVQTDLNNALDLARHQIVNPKLEGASNWNKRQ